MSKVIVSVAALMLTACAGTSEWRSLRIDGSSEAAMRDSLTRLEQQLPRDFHRRMFALALGDVAADNSGNADYSSDDYRADLDGLTYQGVLRLADRAGTPLKQRYYAGRGAPSLPGYDALPGPAPRFNDNGKPAFNAWTTGWPDKGLGGGSTVAIRPDSP